MYAILCDHLNRHDRIEWTLDVYRSDDDRRALSCHNLPDELTKADARRWATVMLNRRGYTVGDWNLNGYAELTQPLPVMHMRLMTLEQPDCRCIPAPCGGIRLVPGQPHCDWHDDRSRVVSHHRADKCPAIQARKDFRAAGDRAARSMLKEINR